MRLFISTTISIAFMWGTQLPMAHAAFDQTPPSLTVSIRPAFAVGNVVTDFPIETVHYTSDIVQLIQWSATDDVGVCSYDLYAVPAGSPPEPLLEFSQETQYAFLGGDYNGDFGGGSGLTIGFRVTARDCTGNATTKAVDEQITVYQEDGVSATDFAVQGIVYTGTWVSATATASWADTPRTPRKPGRDPRSRGPTNRAIRSLWSWRKVRIVERSGSGSTGGGSRPSIPSRRSRWIVWSCSRG